MRNILETGTNLLPVLMPAIKQYKESINSLLTLSTNQKIKTNINNNLMMTVSLNNRKFMICRRDKMSIIFRDKKTNNNLTLNMRTD